MTTKAFDTLISDSSKAKWSPYRSLVGLAQRNPGRSVALLGLGMAMGYGKYKKFQQEKKDSDPSIKKVLVLPFHKMKLVEESQSAWKKLLASSGNTEQGGQNIEMPVDEVVSLIHEAASDPQITALYGILGHGSGFSVGGWAHVEELRNALIVFQQSHRIHREPGKHLEEEQNRHDSKPMYLYSDNFSNPASVGSSGMKDYYLASAFTHVHLQSQGVLDLFGLHKTDTFYRDFLAKYGITVHVWKHGLYKNAANVFTHSRYSKEHSENVSNILSKINQHLCSGIYFSRHHSLKHYEFETFWRMVHQAGSFPASMARRIGFVDFVPNLNPLDDLMKVSKASSKAWIFSEEESKTKEEMAEKWGLTTDFRKFPAASQRISIMEYAQLVKRRKAKAEKEKGISYALQGLPQQIRSFLDFVGLGSDSFVHGKERIAVIKINGAITDSTARKLDKPLRQLKESKDVKAVVFRVDSPGGAVTACETIYQQINDLPQKVVVSFGNVSASGGYYISSNSDRIFASPTTITGSIGVIMLRMDLRALARQWGVNFDSITTSEMSGSYDPFYPVNSRMKENFGNHADRTYQHFKGLVSSGRDLDMDSVEKIAQGRVWTGEQAKQIGLVDELGGLDRAIAYCQRNYTKSGQAKVVSWPPKKSFLQAFLESQKDENEESPDDVFTSAAKFLGFGGKHTLSDGTEKSPAVGELLRSGKLSSGMSGMMLTIDENSAIRCTLEQNQMPELAASLPPGFWD